MSDFERLFEPPDPPECDHSPCEFCLQCHAEGCLRAVPLCDGGREEFYAQQFPMGSLTRRYLLDAGTPNDDVALLSNEDMQNIATHAGFLLLSHGAFKDAVTQAFQSLLAGKIGEIGIGSKPEKPDVQKEFQVCAITRVDLERTGLPMALIEQLPDDVMEAIARCMADIYNEYGYWEDLGLAVDAILQTEQESLETETSTHEFVIDDGDESPPER